MIHEENIRQRFVLFRRVIVSQALPFALNPLAWVEGSVP